MSNALPEHDKILDRELDELVDVISDSGSRRSEFLRLVMGPLAALLIIKWVGRDELERQSLRTLYDTLAVLERDLDDDELERQCDQPSEQRFIEALKRTTADLAAASAATRYVANVAPLVISVAETPFFRVALSMAAGTEIGTPEGRANALQRFDERLRRRRKFIGEFTTPAPVADLMLELVNPRPGDRVYDPCFGFGGLLVGAARRLHATARTEPSPSRNNDARCTGFFGVEIDRVSYAIGLCRTLLADVDRPSLELGDAVDRPLPGSGSTDGFDCVLAVPPLGSRNQQDRRLLPVRFRSRDWGNLFLQHVMANLRPGGRAVVALPERPLFRPGSDRRVRKALVSGYRVEAVILLPTTAFAFSTSVPVNLVVFRRDEPRPTVRFIRIQRRAWQTGPGDGNGHRERGDLQRWLADVVHLDELAEEAIPVGIETWDVPVRNLVPRDYELVAKKNGSEALDAELERIVAADRSVKVKPLGHVAEVRAGLSSERYFTTETRTTPGVVAGLLRVGDVVDSGIRAPSLFLIGEDKRPVRKNCILRGGDIVVTKSGAVGRVGLVSDARGVVGSVASASIVVVRTRGGVTPHFLAALLNSPAYQNWLSGNVRETTFRHLPVRKLRNLPIPVPLAAVQDAVLGELAGVRGDALGVLARLRPGTAPSPIDVWLETPFVAQFVAGRVGDKLDGSEALAAAIDALLSLNARFTLGSELAPPEPSDQRTGAWLDVARQATAALNGVASIPRGAGRLAVLEIGRSRLHEALHMLDTAGGAVVKRRLRSFIRAMAEIVEEEIHVMQESITLGIGMHPAEVTVGIDSEVQLVLTNASNVPLRNLYIEARLFGARPLADLDETGPLVGEDHITYLAEGDTLDVPIAVCPSDTKPLRIAVSWQAQRLDGTAVREDKQLDLQVLSSRTAEPSGELGASPYIVGSPVDRREMFFGRANVMGDIKRQLGGKAHANVILLEGNRRTGKTSILRQLGKADMPGDWIPVYCSFQDAEGDATRAGVITRNVFRLLARTTGWTLYDAGVETWFPDLPGRDPGRPFKLAFRAALDQVFAGEQPFETFALYIAAAIEAASPRRILLMLDEFDKLQEGIDAGITSSQVPENIRHLLQHKPGLSAIITGSRRLKRLREEYWSSLFGLGYRIGISQLPIDEARRLVISPVEGMLNYLPRACDRLVELCACHPFLVQSLCNRVFEQAAAGGKRTITADIVEAAAIGMVRDNEHFRTLWDYAGTERRRLLLILCDRFSDGPDAVNLDLLQVKLHELNVAVLRVRDLAGDVAELRELELIDLDNSYRGGTYRLSVPLMGMWLRLNVDFQEAVVRAQHEAIEAQP